MLLIRQRKAVTVIHSTIISICFYWELRGTSEEYSIRLILKDEGSSTFSFMVGSHKGSTLYEEQEKTNVAIGDDMSGPMYHQTGDHICFSSLASNLSDL